MQRALLLDGPHSYERRRPNGRVLEVRTTALPGGEAVRTFTDVTERSNALEALARRVERGGIAGLCGRLYEPASGAEGSVPDGDEFRRL